MPNIVLAFVLFIPTCLIQATENLVNVEAEGVIIAKTDDGLLEQTEASLSLPPMGRGDLFLKIPGHPDIKAERFFSHRKNGRVVFYVIFNAPAIREVGVNIPLERENEKFIVFRGTYTRGSNLALYYGDIFLGVGGDFQLDLKREDLSQTHTLHYLGGFKFAKEI